MASNWASPLLDIFLSQHKKDKSQAALIPDSPTLPLPARGSLKARALPSVALPERSNEVVAPDGPTPSSIGPVKGVDTDSAPEAWNAVKRPGKMKAFLQGFLANASASANRAMAQGNVGWGGVAQALGGGIGGGAMTAADRSILQRQGLARYEQEQQRRLEQQQNNEMKAAQISDVNSRAVGRDAQATARERQLDINEQSQKDKSEYYKRSQDLRQDALDDKISYREWRGKQLDLDREFRVSKQNEVVRHDKATEGIGASNAESNRIRANRPPAGASSNPNGPQGAYSRAEELQSEIDSLNEEDKKSPAYSPVLDTKTGEIVRDAKGNTQYSNKFTEAYKQRQARKKVLMAQKEKLYTEGRKAAAKAPASSSPGKFNITAWRQSNPDGDVNAAAAKARRLGYVIVN